MNNIKLIIFVLKNKYIMSSLEQENKNQTNVESNDPIIIDTELDEKIIVEKLDALNCTLFIIYNINKETGEKYIKSETESLIWCPRGTSFENITKKGKKYNFSPFCEKCNSMNCYCHLPEADSSNISSSNP